MKKIIYIVLLICNLYANDKIPKATQLEMFLFKIGFTSLVNDFENEKKYRNMNTVDIEELKNNIKIILETMNQNKLKEISDVQIESKNINIEHLVAEISKLKDELKQLKSEINHKTIKSKNPIAQIEKSKYKRNLTTTVNEVNVRQAPRISAKIIRVLTLNQSVNIEYCNKHGWCKLKGEEGYLAKFLLKGFK